MGKRYTPVKVFVSPERLGDLVRDMDRVYTRTLGLVGISNYYSEGFGIHVRPIAADEDSRDIVVFLHPDMVEALTDDLRADTITRRYSSEAP